jgi:hypothetical protein
MRYPEEVSRFLRDYEPAPYANLTKEDIAKFKQMIADYEAKAEEYRQQAIGTAATMKTMCPHVDKVMDSKYHSGDYYDKAYTDYTVKCADCGSILFSTNTQHKHYG